MNRAPNVDPMDPHPRPDALRTGRRVVLALLAASALAIAATGFDRVEPPPGRGSATLGLGIGLGTIVLRRFASSPAVGARTAAWCTAGALVLCGALGALGVWLAYAQASTRTGILFTLAGVIFAVRPTPRVARSA